MCGDGRQVTYSAWVEVKLCLRTRRVSMVSVLGHAKPRTREMRCRLAPSGGLLTREVGRLMFVRIRGLGCCVMVLWLLCFGGVTASLWHGDLIPKRFSPLLWSLRDQYFSLNGANRILPFFFLSQRANEAGDARVCRKFSFSIFH